MISLFRKDHSEKATHVRITQKGIAQLLNIIICLLSNFVNGTETQYRHAEIRLSFV